MSALLSGGAQSENAYVFLAIYPGFCVRRLLTTSETPGALGWSRRCIEVGSRKES